MYEALLRNDSIDAQTLLRKNMSRRNDKALNNQGFVVHKMAEAMGFELMDLLQSTVFKTVALNHSATPPFALRAP